MNEYEFQNDGEGRKKVLLYGGISLAVFAVIGVVAFLVIRNRMAGVAEQATGTAANGSGTVIGSGATSAPSEARTTGLTAAQLEYLSKHPDPPVRAPDVELNVEKKMTPEELRQNGYQPTDTVTYKWIKPANGSAPGRVILSAPPTPSTPAPANWVPAPKKAPPAPAPESAPSSTPAPKQ